MFNNIKIKNVQKQFNYFLQSLNKCILNMFLKYSSKFTISLQIKIILVQFYHYMSFKC